MPVPTATPAVVTAPGAGSAVQSFHAVRVLIATEGLSLFEAVAHPGEEPPMHIHDREDETFHVLEGHLTVHCGGEAHDAPAGTSALLPRGVPHTFTVRSPVARMLVACTPGGFEGMFSELPAPVDMDRAPAVFAAYGIRVTGPNPGL
ncbi:cupin domain-containing protein [Miltoncostaea oceani]|jgi:quercetin dioxygenase-like cupin family protein|uniref:cupin domain-containing protein n=1 Tax=Miltoncostaea oceani TaxID=2843216 RepID=UPI001C3CB9B9|nr:cupin domain-containing protein [Miltoncostaea oceani]